MYFLYNIWMLILWLLSWPLLNAQVQDYDYKNIENDNQRSQITNSNDTGILSDIWTSLTTVNKTSSCPGECVHAITSIFCDNVLENISCGGHMSRCCVSNSQYYSLYGNLPSAIETTPEVVETSPIISAATTTTTTTPSPPTTETFSVISNNHFTTLGYNKLHQDSFGINSENPTTIVESNEPSLYAMNSFETAKNENNPNVTIMCPVQCSKSNAFCVRPMRDAHCPALDEECCLETESTLDTMTKNFIKLVQQTVAMNQTKNIGSEFNAISTMSAISTSAAAAATTTSTTTTTISPLPPCDGTCVVPLFHMLCDEIDHNQFCAHGYCCVNREPTTVAPQISTCDGTCLPVILSGMCTKPYELVLKTIDCGAGTICCAHGKNILDNGHNNPMLPNQNNNAAEESKQSFIKQSRPHIPPPQMMIPSQIPGSHITNYVPNPNLSIPPRVPIQSKPIFPYPVRGNQSPLQLSPPLKIDTGSNKVHFRPPPNIDENHHLKPGDEPLALPPPKPVMEPNFIPKEILPCPGKCINSMFKFTCLAGYSIYKNFKCSKGQICCASNVEIEKLEIFLHNTKMAQQQQIQQHQQHNVPQQANVPKPNINANPLSLEQLPSKNPPPPPPPPPPPLAPPPIINMNQPHPQPTNENTLVTGLEQPVQLSVPMAIIPPPKVIPHPHVCGVKGSKRTARIVGGSDSYPGEWCWQVALVNQHNKYICGGALIGKQWVLTAAHCVTSYLRKNELIIVRAGEYDLTRNNRLAQSQKVTTIYVHHNHNGQSLDNDIALLKLQSPVDLNAYTCLVCLPTKRNYDRTPKDKRCTVTGYGFQHESGPIALRIREAMIPIVDDQECLSKINSVTEKTFILPASSFCAGGRGGNDACQGDGGSGLVCESDGFYELTGLVSWGFGCGRNGVPGVYTKVSSFVGWINQIVSTNAN